MDLIIRHARLRGSEGTWDIGISGNRISAVMTQIHESAPSEVDADGNLVLPTYVNGHIHLDKCHLQDIMRPNKDYTFSECLELTWEHKARYTVEASCSGQVGPSKKVSSTALPSSVRLQMWTVSATCEG